MTPFLYPIFEYSYYNITYFDFFFLCILISFICSLFIILCYLIADQNWYSEKLTGYECGFDPFSDARDPFDIKFYLISILFILFDIELLYFFPWVTCIYQINFFGFGTMFLFYIILLLGFFYEWKKNSLSFD